MSRLHTTLAAFALVAALCTPCRAWLYDGGSLLVSGLQVSDTSSTVWVSEPFILAEDSIVTSLGAGVARGFGTSEMGFNVYISDTLIDVPSHALAAGTLHPAGASFTYQYAYPETGLRLDGGRMYFLTLAPNSNNFLGSVAWSFLAGARYGFGTGNYGQSWSQIALPLAIRLDGYAVSEPETYAVIAAGLACMLLLRRIRGSRRAADRA